MRITSFDPVRFRGQISASETNRLYDTVERLSNIAGRQGIRSSISSAGTFLVNDTFPGFYARISAVNTGSPNTYSWVSQLDDGTGTWQDDPNGLVGDYSTFPAYELNDSLTPVNTIVYMHVGLGSAGQWAWFAYTATSGGGGGGGGGTFAGAMPMGPSYLGSATDIHFAGPGGGFYFPGVISGTATTSANSLAVSSPQFFPFLSTRGGVLNKITIASGPTTPVTGTKCRIAIYSVYSSINPFPENLLLDSGDIAMSVASAAYSVSISFAVTANTLYLVGILSNTNITGGAYMQNISVNQYWPIWGGLAQNNYLGGTSQIAFPVGITPNLTGQYLYGNGWPNPFTVPSQGYVTVGGYGSTTNIIPAIGLQFSS